MIARLERLGEDAHRHERVAQVGRAQERLAPAPPAPLALAPRRRARAQIATRARRAGVGRRPRSRARAARASRRRRASAPPRAASIRRQFDGRSPDCDDRAHGSSPAAKSASATRALQRGSSRGCTRTHASVMTPSVPSEPSSSRSGDGPAPDAGRRRDSHTSPRAVIARIDSTRSSMCVGPVAKCPPARVASQPPSVEQLERLREEAQRHPVLGELRLEPRAGRAGLDARGARDRVDLEHAVEPPEVERHGARVAAGRAPGRRRRRRSCRRRTGTTGEVRAGGPLEHAQHLGLVAGRATASGGCWKRPRSARTTSR